MQEISPLQRAQAVLAGQSDTQTQPAASQPSGQSSDFGTLLQQKLDEGKGIAFSKHARQRVEQRGLEVTTSLLDRLADSVQKAQAKGAQTILALDGGQAFIINVPTSLVITAMDQNEMKENIFTNIDGAVIL